jgi:hypothetical protein
MTISSEEMFRYFISQIRQQNGVLVHFRIQNRKENIPGESIRPADPVVFDRIRIGFRRNSTEPDEIRVGSGRISIVFRRIPTKSGSESDEYRIGSDRNYFDPTGSDHPSVTWDIG